MGFLKSMFGGGPSKNDLIKTLVKKRIAADPFAEASGFTPDKVDSLSRMQLSMLPEAGIVANVETYAKMKKMGASDGEIFERIEAHRSRLISGSMPSGCDLRRYIKYRVDLENATGQPVADESVDHAIDEALRFFGG